MGCFSVAGSARGSAAGCLITAGGLSNHELTRQSVPLRLWLALRIPHRHAALFQPVRSCPGAAVPGLNTLM